jgi:hypothetical protein
LDGFSHLFTDTSKTHQKFGLAAHTVVTTLIFDAGGVCFKGVAALDSHHSICTGIAVMDKQAAL